MFRPTTLRAVLPRSAPRLRAGAISTRFVSTEDAKHPSNAKLAEISIDPETKLPEGEEIDPQRESGCAQDDYPFLATLFPETMDSAKCADWIN
jgi:hypothetical protein